MSDARPNPELVRLLEVLRLEKAHEGLYMGHDNVPMGASRVVYGGQLLGQMVVAAAAAIPDKSVKSLHALFVRGASLDDETTFEVETLHAGRMYGNAEVSVRQGDRLCARALVLLDQADTELARHEAEMPAVAPPDGLPGRFAMGGAEVRVVGGVDLDEEAGAGPPEYRVWVRFAGIDEEEATNQALLAFAGEPYFFGLALRPHEGLSQAQAYRTVIPSVITHSVFFHGPFSASEWMLFDLHNPHLGRGRIFGYGSVFTARGELVASITQENQLRPIRPAPDGPGGAAPGT